ncbi:hypothetical protein Tco_1398606, partial [Tanacetum coccineum]
MSEFWYTARTRNNLKVWFSTPTGGILGEVKWFPTIGYGVAVKAKGTLKKSLLPSRWSLLMALIIQCLGGKTGGFDQITNKDAIILYSLANGVNIDYAKLIWEDIITKLNKKTREKMCQWNIKLPIPLPTLGRRIPKAKSLELNLDIGSNQLLLNITLCPRLRQPNVASTPIVAGLYKEDQQATSGPTSLGFTSEGGANPQLSSGMSASIHNKPIYSVSTIIHSKSALEHDVLAKSKVGADSGLSAPKDSISQTTEKTKSTSEGSKDKQKEIKLEDLSRLVQDVGVNFMDLDSPNNDEPIIVQDDSDEEVHAKKSQNYKLEQLKNKAEAKVAILTAQPSFPNVEQLTKLLVKSLQPELSKILSTHDFSSSL